MSTYTFLLKRRVRCLATVFFILFLAAGSSSFAARVCEDAPMVPWEGKIEQLYPGKMARVEVTVVDERPYTALLAEGLLGRYKKVKKGEGLYYAFMSQIPDEVATFVANSAKEAVAVLGLDEGPLASLQIVIKDLQVDLWRVSNGPMYCVAYLNLDVSLKAETGEILARSQPRMVYWENTVPFWVFNEVAKEALSRIHQHIGWQVTMETLLGQFPQEADPEAVGKLIASMPSGDDEMIQREMIFWLGLVGRGNSEVAEELRRIFRTSNDERVAEAACEALGMLGVPGHREEVEALLSGSKELRHWDLKDFEANWYLLKTLHLLGETDLAARITTKEIKLKNTLHHLVDFLAEGTLPPRSPKMVEGLKEAKEELQESLGN